jgi:hypothetical protein
MSALSALTLGAGLLLIGQPATAAPAGPAAGGDSVSSHVSSHRAATSKNEQRRVTEYWSVERMRSAVPAESRFVRPAKGKPTNGGGKKGNAVQEQTQPMLGKVFFTEGGTNYVCSGTATSSSNRDVVTTAGHCVNEGPGAYVTNFAFVPAYDNGAAPYGKWTANTLVTTTQWKNSGDFNYDVGFAVMNSNSAAQSLTDVVGSYPIGFNLPKGLNYTSYGYPAARPYDGQTLWSCSGTVIPDTYGGSTDQGLACSMTGGSSGGGWITGGTLNSVNSFKYTGLSTYMWGPYFGSVIQSAYQAAATS